MSEQGIVRPAWPCPVSVSSVDFVADLTAKRKPIILDDERVDMGAERALPSR